MPGPSSPLIVGRYALYDELAAGGMGTVHLGRLLGAAGFARTVAIKRLHPQLARDHAFATALLDEARLAARIHHPNVVQTLDVVAASSELFVVMEYVVGESLAGLFRARKNGPPLPVGAVVTILIGALNGLHAAHEAKSERGEPLLIVHRDVSPQNVLVGQDGVTRVLDFGIAKAIGRQQQTGDGVIKGKLGYMPPEQVRGEAIDRRADVYAAGVVLWEALTGRRLFQADSEWATAQRIFSGLGEPPSLYRPEVPPELDDILLKACHVDPRGRFASAEAFAAALEELKLAATAREVREIVVASAGERLAERAAKVAAMEHASLALEAGEDASAASSPGAAAAERPSNTGARANVELAPPRRRSAIPIGLGVLALVIAAGVSVAARRGTPAEPASTAAPEPRSEAPAPTPVPAASSDASEPSAPSASTSAEDPPPSARASAAPPKPNLAGPRPTPRPPSRGVFDNRH